MLCMMPNQILRKGCLCLDLNMRPLSREGSFTWQITTIFNSHKKDYLIQPYLSQMILFEPQESVESLVSRRESSVPRFHVETWQVLWKRLHGIFQSSYLHSSKDCLYVFMIYDKTRILRRVKLISRCLNLDAYPFRIKVSDQPFANTFHGEEGGGAGWYIPHVLATIQIPFFISVITPSPSFVYWLDDFGATFYYNFFSFLICWGYLLGGVGGEG